MAEGGQREAELKAGRSEKRARNGVERRHGVAAVAEKGDCGWRSACAGGAPTGSS